MDKIPRLIPVWLWMTVIVIIVLLCSSCRGGRSLGKGSAGTVIVPQTPQEINERNTQPLPEVVLPPLEPLAPIPIVPPTPVAPPKAIRSTPTPPENKSAEANPVITNPKPAGESKSFTPTINKNAPPVKLPPVKLIEGDGGCAVITSTIKNPPTDNKATTPEIATPANKAVSFNWVELLLNYLLFIIIAIFIWTIYDIFKGEKAPPKRGIKGKRRASKRSKPSKKKGSKKN